MGTSPSNIMIVIGACMYNYTHDVKVVLERKKNACMKIEECNQGVAKTENIRRHRYDMSVLLRYIVFFRH